MTEPDEPDIIINGQRLTIGQTMAVRVAVDHFRCWCIEQREAGVRLPDYEGRLGEVIVMMVEAERG